jgi:hypothetical protein
VAIGEFGVRAEQYHLKRLDSNVISTQSEEIRGFACVKNEIQRLPYFLNYHRALGVDRFFIIDNRSTDGTRRFLLSQPDVHCFDCADSFFEGNVEPPRWTNSILNVFGDGYWCLTLDPDELLVYPFCESVNLKQFCAFLEKAGADTLATNFVDMYCDGPILKARYHTGLAFVDFFPYFDRSPGWTQSAEGQYPPVLTFGGVRERAFWNGRLRKPMPPCLTKVPLVRWRRGKRYLVVNHLISEAIISDVTAALLHFKYMPGFFRRMESSVADNDGVVEKGLEERGVYVAALAKNPKLTLRNPKSVRYRDSRQLIELGLIYSPRDYTQFANTEGHRKRPTVAVGAGVRSGDRTTISDRLDRRRDAKTSPMSLGKRSMRDRRSAS